MGDEQAHESGSIRQGEMISTHEQSRLILYCISRAGILLPYLDRSQVPTRTVQASYGHAMFIVRQINLVQV